MVTKYRYNTFDCGVGVMYTYIRLVPGTLVTLLAALGTAGVRRFIHCSSTSCGIGYDTDTSGLILESDPVPQHFIFEPYASSKLTSERMVLAANSKSIQLYRVCSLLTLV